MKHWSQITVTPASQVLSIIELDYIKKHKDELLEVHACHANAAKIALVLADLFDTQIEFCEGCFDYGEILPEMAHCWNRVKKDSVWYHIDITSEILLETNVDGRTLFLYETWTPDAIEWMFNEEGFSFTPYVGTSDFGDKYNTYYIKDENGLAVAKKEPNDWKVLHKRATGKDIQVAPAC